ncbi:ribonuclease J [Candidatus Nomurabacteria bacterium]|uniref:Ribonuclease J n=1 Tax=candidate division WWE3 bacterium TaxID=2053526 RepID=A0A955DZ29_UNCKA|nr:ribonuclease J [candidate division WWE3 bacterium]MCB9823827.1 ribonuclease J [Candidatus Nomurabacteria bacterium]MCB9826767.1 ribonuclease J [Candidatus Nomurabacteria bacterium]MCB9827622.1 ribonuclease J [Candidatus Nomurabacteria bacterium]HXK52474.1 ribonuclease J [bacterium]
MNTNNFNSVNSIQPELRIIGFSGAEGATKNMTVYESGTDIIIVDCGIGFPDDELRGVDVVIPDFTYILENIEKVRGLFVTHGHEDHLGAIPYLLKEANIKIFTTPIVQGFIRSRLLDRGSQKIHDDVSFYTMVPGGEAVTLGNFSVSAFHVNHSVPDSVGLAIKTPQGTVLHMADYKIDLAPVIDKPMDFAAISNFGKEGVLCLLSDCLGANKEGHSKYEQSMKGVFTDLYEKGEGKQIIITTISSNISRMYQIMDAATKSGRKVVLLGRSINNSVEIARGLDMLPFSDELFVSHRDSMKHSQSELVYIAAGCFGQQGSALDRISRGEHRDVTLEEDALVIFSADPAPPGTRIPVERLMDQLTLKGAEVIYTKIQDNLHVSGHGPKGDLELVASMVNPKYFIPIGGSVTQMRAYTSMVKGLGYSTDQVFEMLEGEILEFTENGALMLDEKIDVKQVYVDGTDVGEIGEVVIKDREILANEGVFVVVVPYSKTDKQVKGNSDVITRGFVYVKNSKQLMGTAKDLVNKIIDKSSTDEPWTKLQAKIEQEVSKLLKKETGRDPMVIVHALYV